MNDLRLLDLLFQSPLVNVNLVRNRLNISYSTANRLTDQFKDLGRLEGISNTSSSRVFRYTPYWRLFEDSEPLVGREPKLQTTESEA